MFNSSIFVLSAILLIGSANARGGHDHWGGGHDFGGRSHHRGWGWGRDWDYPYFWGAGSWPSGYYPYSYRNYFLDPTGPYLAPSAGTLTPSVQLVPLLGATMFTAEQQQSVKADDLSNVALGCDIVEEDKVQGCAGLENHSGQVEVIQAGSSTNLSWYVPKVYSGVQTCTIRLLCPNLGVSHVLWSGECNASQPGYQSQQVMIPKSVAAGPGMCYMRWFMTIGEGKSYFGCKDMQISPCEEQGCVPCTTCGQVYQPPQQPAPNVALPNDLSPPKEHAPVIAPPPQSSLDCTTYTTTYELCQTVYNQ